MVDFWQPAVIMTRILFCHSCGQGGKIQLSLESLASLVRRALSDCHGCVGGAIPFDALLFQESTGIAVLRMHKR